MSHFVFLQRVYLRDLLRPFVTSRMLMWRRGGQEKSSIDVNSVSVEQVSVGMTCSAQGGFRVSVHLTPRIRIKWCCSMQWNETYFPSGAFSFPHEGVIMMRQLFAEEMIFWVKRSTTECAANKSGVHFDF